MKITEKSLFNSSGFTLIELLIVISIIALIGSFISASVTPLLKKGKKAQAKADIACLEVAIQSYSNDYYAYPPDMTNQQLVSLLTDISTYITHNKWQGPYLQLKKNKVIGGCFLDPWNNEYKYQNCTDGNSFAGGPYNPNFVDIYSFGPDKNNDGGQYDGGVLDDINNWEKH